MKKLVVPVVAVTFLLSGCATTTGPKITSFEIRQAKERLKAKAIKHRFAELQRVVNIGHRLIMNLPEEDRKSEYPLLGIKVAKINKTIGRAYNLPVERGMVVIAVIEGSPAEKAGLRVGDVILRIENRKIKGIGSFRSATSRMRLKDRENIEIEVNRYGENKIMLCEVGTVPRKIAFEMVDRQEVNAGAGHNLVLVTYGLMKFAESDDEIAVVIGHELAHITKGHVSKAMGVEMLAGLTALGVGILSEHLSPGSGYNVIRAASGVGQIFSRSYSRDLEREADYFGLKYTKLAGYDYEVASGVWERFAIEVPRSMVQNYLNTHPTSPERMVRLGKIIKELKTEDEAGLY